MVVTGPAMIQAEAWVAYFGPDTSQSDRAIRQHR
jgi:hypothetical protein